eukprot:COSAG06_NODE_17549_length_934_cov_13.878025_1_plen_191_part_01
MDTLFKTTHNHIVDGQNSDRAVSIGVPLQDQGRVYTPEEVRGHTSPQSCWVVVDKIVYDVSTFARTHPGGTKLLRSFGGRDVSLEFAAHHPAHVLDTVGVNLRIGRLTAVAEHDPTDFLVGFTRYQLQKITTCTHNVKRFQFSVEAGGLSGGLCVPLGAHVILKFNADGVATFRPYTPLFTNGCTQTFDLL